MGNNIRDFIAAKIKVFLKADHLIAAVHGFYKTILSSAFTAGSRDNRKAGLSVSVDAFDSGDF